MQKSTIKPFSWKINGETCWADDDKNGEIFCENSLRLFHRICQIFGSSDEKENIFDLPVKKEN